MAWAWPRRWQSDGEPKKPMVKWDGVSFADWLLADACTEILVGSGVPESQITFTFADEGMRDIIRLPLARKWERRFAFPATRGIVAALDDLCAACACRWRCTRDGKVDVYQVLPWDGVCEHEITEATEENLDMLERIRAEFDPNSRRNVVLHIGRSKSGSAVAAVVHDADSLFNVASPDFIGDDWWTVREDPAIDDPELTAFAELERRLAYRKPITWNWAGHPDWEPGHRVRVTVSGVGIEAGTVFQILEKDSTISADGMSYGEQCRGGILGVQQ
jgi:hypothetical protein